MGTTSSEDSQEELRSTAYHEAGHAIVGAWLGLRVETVTICPSEDHLGFARFGSEALQRLATAASETPSFEFLSARVRKGLETELIMAFAGPTAEAHFHKKKRWLPGHEGDFVHAVDLVDQFMPRRSAEAYLRWLCERSRNYVTHPQIWPAIRQLAKLLLQKTTVSGAGVRAIVREARSGRR